MPQINIHEIDQSIVNRVASDNRLRILIPGVASFGPVCDGTTNSLISFTDTTAFYKVFGYTEPEYNPLESDVSRIYATQLIDKGAEVSFIRLNEGETAEFDIGHSTEGTISVTEAAKHSNDYSDDLSEDELKKFQFCEQIKYIRAKYTGSFGNNLLLTFSPVNSSNVPMSYQYSVVTVYRAEYVSSAKTVIVEDSPAEVDEHGNITKEAVTHTETRVTKTISRVHKLESKTVSTNPNDPTYFEDVEFDFIEIKGTDTARKELMVMWSNVDVNPEIHEIYSGFPKIPLKYKVEDDITTLYNTDALLKNGMDFKYCENVKKTLLTGFKGLVPTANGLTSGSTKTISIQDINAYIWNVYNNEDDTFVFPEEDKFAPGSTPGILKQLYDNLQNCFMNYTDPYMYDFDFITSGGIIPKNWEIKKDSSQTKASSYSEIKESAKVCIVTSTGSSDIAPTELLNVHKYMKELVTTRKDCVALCDPDPDWAPEIIPDYEGLLNTSYCTMHAPWCWCAHPVNGSLVLMPPSFVFLHTISTNLINNVESQKWFPPAGVTRATARIVKKPQYEIGSVLLNLWQNETIHRVNPIMKLKDYGYVIYGQFTALEPIDEYTRSASESLNVRLISNVVKKQIFNTCIRLAFEPNNSTLWLKFYDSMDKYLSFMKRNDGLYDYKILMDDSTVTTDDINELRCPGKVWIAPTRTAEEFDIDFILTDAGVTFNE